MSFLLHCLVVVLVIVLVFPMLDMIQVRNQRIVEMEKKLSQLTKALSIAEKDRVHIVNTTVSDYFRETDFDTFRSRIESAVGVDGEDISELENYVNEARQGILRRLRQQMPELPEDDIRLICFIYAGLSYKTIRLLTDESMSNLYSRKSRLLRLIEASDTPDKNEFVEQLKYVTLR